MEPYLRHFGEDDVAYLSQKVSFKEQQNLTCELIALSRQHVQPEDLTAFIIPALGRHYLDQWQEDDSSPPPPGASYPAPTAILEPPPLERFRAEDISEDKLLSQNIYMGPISERLLSALATEGLTKTDTTEEAPVPSTSAARLDLSASTTGTEVQPSPVVVSTGPTSFLNSIAAAQATSIAQPAPMDAISLEDRLRRELRFLGVFPPDPQGPPGNKAKDGEIDWSSRADDEISAALRACQRQLSEQVNVNESRKAKLVDRVRDRMAYQEYESMRDGLEKAMEVGWLKRQRILAKRKLAAKAREEAAAAAAAADEGAPAVTASSSKSKASDDPNAKLPLSESLLSTLDKRRRLVDGIAPIFRAEPSRYVKLPEESIYGEEGVVVQTTAKPPVAAAEESAMLVD